MSKTQDLLKKINYIEADIEIQKQILFSIPANQQAEMEKTIASIAAKKAEIQKLRQEIKEIDPEEFDRILIFEMAVSEFKELSTTRQFTSITGKNINESCSLALIGGKSVECLIKACDPEGNWTIISLEGEIRHFPAAEVAEKASETPLH